VSAFSAADGPRWASKARRAQELGFDVLLVPDHLDESFAPIAALASAAAATSTLRLGTYVLNNDLRNPVVVAQEAITLDVLSGGRFELGLGAGHMKGEYDGSGVSFDPGRARAERLRESVHIIRRCLTGEEPERVGRWYDPRGRLPLLAPVQRPHPPILIGGGGRRMLSMAACEAQIVSVVPRSRVDGSGLDADDLSMSSLERKIEWVRSAALESGTDPELNTLIQEVRPSRDARAAAEELAPEWGRDPDEVRDCPYALLGSVNEIVDRLLELRERHGLSYVTVFEDAMEAFAPALAALAGR
jgi:probable F420-dependent oxidoreductase